MKYVFTLVCRIARPFLITAFLLILAIAGVSRYRTVLIHESAFAQSTVAVVNAASFANDANSALAPDTIGAAFGSFVTQNNQAYSANSLPLPTTLGGVRATVNNLPVGLFFVSPGQINLLIPANVTDGVATIVVTNSDNTTRTGNFNVVRSAPGIFSAKSNGQGTAAAVTTTDGINYQAVANPDGSERDVSAGTKETPNILVLYTTGLRYTPTQNPNDGNGVAEAVSVKIQGVSTLVSYAGPAPFFAGLDQINVVIPPEMSSMGILKIVVSANGRDSNKVTIKIGGEPRPITLTSIVMGETKNGNLTSDDQIVKGTSGNLFFIDGYDFTTTTTNVVIAIDMRSTQLNAGLLLYRVNQDFTLDDLAYDDDLGGAGNNDFVNGNSLLLYVVDQPGRYAIFATSSDKQPAALGPYTLKLSTIAATQLNYGQNISNAAITNTDLQTSGGDYLDVYWFNGVTDDNVRITMTAPTFNALFLLWNNDNQKTDFFAFGDAGGVGNTAQTTARLVITSPHIVIATPFASNVTGAYTLSISKLASFQAEASPEQFANPGRLTREQRTGFLRPDKGRMIEQ